MIKVDLARRDARQAVFMLEQAPVGVQVIVDVAARPESDLWPLVHPLVRATIERSLRLVFQGDQLVVGAWITLIRELIADQSQPGGSTSSGLAVVRA